MCKFAEAFEHFEKGGEFFCFVGQSTQAVTGVYNLYRASQVLFPGEKILGHAKQFSAKYLKAKTAADLLDKWIIAKDLPGEVWSKNPFNITQIFLCWVVGEVEVEILTLPFPESNSQIKETKSHSTVPLL